MRDRPEMFALRGIKNARVEKSIEAMERSLDPVGVKTVDDLRTLLAEAPVQGLFPQDVWSLGGELNYQVDISWAACRPDGNFDVVFRQLADDQRPRRASVQWIHPNGLGNEPGRYTNNPGLFARRRKLIGQLRDYTSGFLSAQAVSAAFVLVDSLPLTQDGQVDCQGFSPPDPA